MQMAEVETEIRCRGGVPMDRRAFVAAGAGSMLGMAACDGDEQVRLSTEPQSVRDRFPRLERETFVNGAGGTPLGAFAETGIQRYLSPRSHKFGDVFSLAKARATA
jgi:hypothetical protein